MANECYGFMKAVAKSVKALERLNKIGNYKDDEFYLYGSREFSMGDLNGPDEDGFYDVTFSTSTAWDSSKWFGGGDHPETKVVIGFGKRPDGTPDYNDEKYGTSHLTDLLTVCKELDVGVELFGREPGLEFCEHYAVNHEGCLTEERIGYYSSRYPLDENGDPDDTKDEIVESEFVLDEFMSNRAVYGAKARAVRV